MDFQALFCRVGWVWPCNIHHGGAWSFIQFGPFVTKQIASKAGHPRSWINT